MSIQLAPAARTSRSLLTLLVLLGLLLGASPACSTASEYTEHGASAASTGTPPDGDHHDTAPCEVDTDAAPTRGVAREHGPQVDDSLAVVDLALSAPGGAPAPCDIAVAPDPDADHGRTLLITLGIARN